MSSLSRGGRAHKAFLRIAAAALLAGNVAAMPTPAQALTCGSTYCGEVTIKPISGLAPAGNGHITSDPPGIDCTITASITSGTCLHVFGWEGSTSIYVDLDIQASGDSYVCYITTCTGIGGSIGTSIVLAVDDTYDVRPTWTLGTSTTLTFTPDPSTGSGGITSSPAGIDCRISKGVRSGTCQHTFWYIGNGITFDLTVTPDTGSFGCLRDFMCGAPSTPWKGSLGVGPGPHTQYASFWIPVPTKVSVSGSGTLVSSPAGISCPSACSKWFPIGQFITLTATPAAGWVLADWGGICDSIASSSNTCYISSRVDGATASVTFKSLATAPPPPSPTPRPTATPQSTARPTGAPTLAPTSPASGPTPPAASGDATSPSPNETGSGAGTVGATPPAASGSAAAAAAATPVGRSDAPAVSAVDRAGSGGPDIVPLLLVLVGVLIAVVVALIVAVARLRAGRRPS